MSQSEDDLFEDLPASPPPLLLSLDSHHISLSVSGPAILLTLRHLPSNASSSLRLPLPTPPSRLPPLLLLSSAPHTPHSPADPQLLATLGAGPDETAGVVGTPSGSVLAFPVRVGGRAGGWRLVAGLGEAVVGLAGVVARQGSVLVAVGVRGRLAVVCGSGEVRAARARVCGTVMVCEAVRNVVFAGTDEGELAKVEFKEEGDLSPVVSVTPLRGRFSSCLFIPSSSSPLPFSSVCLDPLPHAAHDGPPPLPSTLTALHDAARRLQALRAHEAAVDERLTQLNAACHLRLLSDDRRAALLACEVSLHPASDPNRRRLRLNLHNRLDAKLSQHWTVCLRVHHTVLSTPLTAMRKGERQVVEMEVNARRGGVEVRVDALLTINDGDRSVALRVPLCSRSLSLLHMLSDCGEGVEGEGLCVDVPLRSGDRFSALPPSLLFLDSSTAQSVRFSLAGRRVGVARTSAGLRVCGPDVGRVRAVAAAVASLINRRKVGSEEAKKDLLLLRVLRRACVKAEDERALCEVLTAAHSLMCV